ncbi:hypothetical protein BGZ96_001747 [Linnemannia gamsii]|uniref:F-box domain-containing protein n=1 Tax=Linnemannia gamsii TaxID=64522 RepID=A0ABQ7KAL9_9FUNG|nr:hypothetical protein BGZ96_001747 [Linnemannia gamsii]
MSTGGVANKDQAEDKDIYDTLQLQSSQGTLPQHRMPIDAYIPPITTLTRLVITRSPFGTITWPLNLRSLMLDSVIIKPENLENMLNFTPRLKVLKLAAMSKQYANYDWSQFLGHLRSLPISLDLVHISARTD